MNKRDFRIMHSELIEYFQCIEFDLKRIYAAMCEGEFEENFGLLKRESFGAVLKKLKELDYSDGYPFFNDADYKFLNEFRKLRNYWCHECYLQFVYEDDLEEKEYAYRSICDCLVDDHYRTGRLHKKLERIYFERFYD